MPDQTSTSTAPSTQILLVCHAPLASALHAVACHAFNARLSQVIAVDVMPCPDCDTVASQIDAAVRDAHPTVADADHPPMLLLTDLQGASPANGATRWLERLGRTDIPAMAGVSLALLLRALTYQHLPPDALAAELLKEGRCNACVLDGTGCQPASSAAPTQKATSA